METGLGDDANELRELLAVMTQPLRKICSAWLHGLDVQKLDTMPLDEMFPILLPLCDEKMRLHVRMCACVVRVCVREYVCMYACPERDEESSKSKPVWRR